MLETGNQIPHFTLPDQDGNMHDIDNYKGRWVVLYFYPKDMTPGCTTEACNFQETLPEFNSIEAVIFGISKDSVARHKKFAEKHNLQFTLLSDENSNVCEQFGVWQKKSMYGKEFMGIVRSTFLVNPDGKIAKVYPKVKVKEHHTEILNDLKALK
ncbi:MAG: thioredoxin-dependent thiol peroxidase [Calditrichaceae bacterium]|jgi:thioredoxin-dependent peroxiredoxin